MSTLDLRSSLLLATSSPEDPMIDMHGIVKTFKNAAGEFTALRGVDLTIQRGEFVSIVGKSGSGKSTLLNMITGIDHPTHGHVIIGGTDIYTGVTEKSALEVARQKFGDRFSVFPVIADADIARECDALDGLCRNV